MCTCLLKVNSLHQLDHGVLVKCWWHLKREGTRRDEGHRNQSSGRASGMGERPWTLGLDRLA